MRRLLPALAVLLALSAQAQVPADSLPPLSPPLRGDVQPLQPSAPRAIVYSVLATGGVVGLGYVLYAVPPEGDPMRDGLTLRDVGTLVAVLGVVGGPAVGNLTLGAMGDVGRGQLIRAAGVVSGGALALGTLGACRLADAIGDGCGLGIGLLIPAGAAVAFSGLVAGMVYDFATIPGNARAARRGGVAVGLGRGGVPTVGLRVGL